LSLSGGMVWAGLDRIVRMALPHQGCSYALGTPRS
jgi:hypothetical protein